MMELKEFIEQTMSDIVESISDLKNKYDHDGRFIVASLRNENENIACHKVEFDVAVTTSENGAAKAGSKIGISVLGANINGEKGYINENVSRIKFSIPYSPEHINRTQK